MHKSRAYAQIFWMHSLAGIDTAAIWTLWVWCVEEQRRDRTAKNLTNKRATTGQQSTTTTQHRAEHAHNLCKLLSLFFTSISFHVDLIANIGALSFLFDSNLLFSGWSFDCVRFLLARAIFRKESYARNESNARRVHTHTHNNTFAHITSMVRERGDIEEEETERVIGTQICQLLEQTELICNND